MGKNTTIPCNAHPSPILFSTPVLTCTLAPQHCAHCSTSSCFLTETDGWDSYALSLNSSRKMAILLLNKFDRNLHTQMRSATKSKAPYVHPSTVNPYAIN